MSDDVHWKTVKVRKRTINNIYLKNSAGKLAHCQSGSSYSSKKTVGRADFTVLRTKQPSPSDFRFMDKLSLSTFFEI